MSPAEEDPTTRAVGRPRDESVEERVLPVVRKMLTEVGWDGLSVRAVANQAGVGRATINRRWATKAELVLDAVLGELPDPARFDGLDRHGWVEWVLDGSRELFARPEVRAAVPGLLTALDRDPHLRTRLWSEFSRPAAALFEPAASGDLDARAIMTLAAGASLFLELVVDAETGAIHDRIKQLVHHAVRE